MGTLIVTSWSNEFRPELHFEYVEALQLGHNCALSRLGIFLGTCLYIASHLRTIIKIILAVRVHPLVSGSLVGCHTMKTTSRFQYLNYLNILCPVVTRHFLNLKGPSHQIRFAGKMVWRVGLTGDTWYWIFNEFNLRTSFYFLQAL
jgi:hypothetical protein